MPRLVFLLERNDWAVRRIEGLQMRRPALCLSRLLSSLLVWTWCHILKQKNFGKNDLGMDFPMGFPKNWWWVAIFSILFPHDLCPLKMSGKIVGSSAVDAEEADLWSAGGLAQGHKSTGDGTTQKYGDFGDGLWNWVYLIKFINLNDFRLPVPHKAVAEVSKIGNL